jgi:hypothetical protein
MIIIVYDMMIIIYTRTIVIYAMPWMIMISKDHVIIVVKFCDIKSNNYYDKMHPIVEI